MPTTAQTPSRGHDRGRTAPWITAASMFVGQRLDKRSAVGAYMGAGVTLLVSVIILLVTHR